MPVFVALVSESLQNIWSSSRWHLRCDLRRKCPKNHAITQRIVSEIKSSLMHSWISWNLDSYPAIGCAVCPGAPSPGG
jgi:hypothetical protein